MEVFETPAFLRNHSPEEVHALMRRVLPADIDLSAGGHAYNLTFATALAVSEVCEFVLPEVIKLIFPEYSYGEFVDGHARGIGMTRRSAAASSGKLTITGSPLTIIPEGSLFSTASVNGQPSVDYRTLRNEMLPMSGTATVDIECTQTGTIGNTPANTIVHVSSRLNGITAVTNEEPLTGGTEEEDDESLIARIVEFNKSQGESFVGNAYDYKRWAMSVPGVGNATVIPAEDTSGLITIVVTDANGAPATEQLCTAVYNYIMKPDAPNERLAPINSVISVEAPQTIRIGIAATVEFTNETTHAAVKESFMAQLALYLAEAMEDREIKYSRVWAALSATVGVNDFTDLQIGVKTGNDVAYGTSNIKIAATQLPVIDLDDISLQTGTV